MKKMVGKVSLKKVPRARKNRPRVVPPPPAQLVPEILPSLPVAIADLQESLRRLDERRKRLGEQTPSGLYVEAVFACLVAGVPEAALIGATISRVPDEIRVLGRPLLAFIDGQASALTIRERALKDLEVIGRQLGKTTGELIRLEDLIRRLPASVDVPQQDDEEDE